MCNGPHDDGTVRQGTVVIPKMMEQSRRGGWRSPRWWNSQVYVVGGPRMMKPVEVVSDTQNHGTVRLRCVVIPRMV